MKVEIIPSSTCYDVFLSYRSDDNGLVEELARRLEEAGASIFLASSSIRSGEAWLPVLESALKTCRAFVVCLGSSGPSPWMEREINSAVVRATQDTSCLVVPVLLPGSSREQLNSLSLLLSQHQASDLRRGFEGKAFEELLATLGVDRPGKPWLNAGFSAQLSTEILEKIERLQGRFFESLRPILAGGELISRKETQEVLSLLEDDGTRILVIHGTAGSGKSGVLFELAQELADQNVILPLRLDRVELRGESPRQFGREILNLPDSPGRCLARVGKDNAILLLDQLDALRWTGLHSSEAWSTCREIILDALAASPFIKVVVCCRSFDLQHDPQFKAWKEGTKNLKEVRVTQLTLEQVRAAVDRASATKGKTRFLDEKELDLLRHIHHLQMWLTLYPKLGLRGSLATRRALIEAFWQDRREQLEEAGVDRWEALEVRFFEEFEEGARLSAPVGTLRLSSRELKAYQSLHIFEFDLEHNSVCFCHQTYLDYLVAVLIGKDLEHGRKSLLSWLGPKTKQSLFRREQLRLVLEDLRERNADVYLIQLQELVAAHEGARFHLRVLCLQFLSQLKDPSHNEKVFVSGLLDDLYWHEHVLGDLVHGQVTWFEALDDEGRFEHWLAGDDAKLRDAALEVLLYVVGQSGDRVARLLQPYLGKDRAWDHRILSILRFDPDQDSDALFDLRIALAKQGAFGAKYWDWRKLAEQHPMRLLLLVCFLLMSHARDLLEKMDGSGFVPRPKLDCWYHLDQVNPAAMPAEIRSTAWDYLFKSVMAVARIRRDRGQINESLETYEFDFDSIEPVLKLLRRIGGLLLETDWAEFVALGESLSQGDLKSEIVFLDSLTCGPAHEGLADWALGWLMVNPWRARLHMAQSSNEWSLSGRLIDRYSSVCSSETFHRLESWLLSYCEPDLVERFKSRRSWMDRSHIAVLPNAFGSTPHALLPKLAPQRRSAAVDQRIAELVRKLGPVNLSAEHDEYGARAGFVGSPLRPEILHRMGDRAVLNLVASGKLSAAPKWKKNHFEVASLSTIGSDLRMATQREPERFGRLLTRWPAIGHSVYLTNILSGLSYPKESGRKPEPTWQPPSHALLEIVIALPIVQSLARDPRDLEVAKCTCDLIRDYSDYPWSNFVIDFVSWVAENHPDPKAGYFPIGSRRDDSEVFDDLASNALNVTRGRAAYAIQSMLFKQPDRLVRLRPAIRCLIRDPHPAVRVAALGVCLPVLNIEKDIAVEWFLEACEGPEQLLATREAWNFIRYSYRTHLAQLLPTLDHMMISSSPQVATSGAKWVAAAFMVAGEVEERFERCIAGPPNLRLGIAEVAGELMIEPGCTERATATLLRLAEDPDEKVAQAVAWSFRKLDLQHYKAHRQDWSHFARSKAFQSNPTPLLLALEEHSGDLLPFSDCVLTVGSTFAEDLAEATRDRSRGLGMDASHHLVPLLLRLYEQAKDHDEAVYLRCLDLWDRLLERRVGSAIGLTRELDRL